MGARLRRSGRAGLVTFLVVIALVGSAIIASAAVQPKAAAYPSTANRVRGHGYCSYPFSRTHFDFDIRTDSSKRLVGRFVTQMGVASPLTFYGNRPASLFVSGTSGQFEIWGQVRGNGPGAGAYYKATVKFTGQIGEAYTYRRSTIDITVASPTKTLYTKSCTISGGRVVIPKNART